MSRRKKRKAEPKQPETTAQGRLRRLRTLLVLVALPLLAATVGGVLLLGSVTGGSAPAPGPKTAVIVDQLSLTQPNPAFVASASNLLVKAGYAVDYFEGEQVTVEFYRNLPKRDYDLIILRVHSGITREVDPNSYVKTETEYVSLFTGEPFSELIYREERTAGRLGKAFYEEGGPAFFGIAPGFIESSMKGDFDGARIVMMGCDGLRSERTAQAFLDRGAEEFVSWSRPVSADHTDAATQLLLQKLLWEGLPIADAVSQTATEVGPDPLYGAELRVLSAGG